MKAKTADLKKLQDLGYSKTKASGALKDAGGNINLAINILNNLAVQEEQRKQLLQTIQSKSIASVITKPQPAEKPESSPAVKQRTHPCVVQHKKCQYGRHCLLRDFPGDTCINYFNGTCLYGSYCTKKHYVDGVDIRSGRRQCVDDGTMFLPTGEIITLTEACGAKVYKGKVIQSAAKGHSDCAPPPPAPSRFNAIVGSEPSHTDPLVPAPSVESFFPENIPQPFLDAVRRTPDKQQQEHGKSFQTIRVNGQARDESERVVDSATGRAKHPCVAQFGSCRFGKDCMHADRDADVCVFYLNNRCKRGADCPYRHESNVSLLLRTRPDIWGSNGEFSHASRLEGTHAHPHDADRDEHNEAHRLGYDCTDTEGAQPAPVLLSSYLPGDWPESLEPQESLESLEPLESVSAIEAREGARDDEELTALIGLLGAFPQVEPQQLLQALRAADGDVNFVADVLSRLDAFHSVEAMNAFLWQERAAEEESLQESAVRSRHESFLTLCSLFPAVEVKSIETALESCRGDYAEAYGMLLCSSENLTRSDYGNFWCGSIKPADELRVSKLCAMFPTLPEEVLRSAFGAAACDFARAVEALNEMTRDLLQDSPKAEEKKKPCAAPEARPAAVQPAPNVPAFLLQRTSTSEELNKFRSEVDAELREAGDWRRVREKAYIVNTCRLRVLSQATAAYLRGDGKTAKALSRNGKSLGAEYVRLNRVAMIALERERLATHPASTLDLHGFHVEEAVEVLRRRVQLCVAKGIERLTVVVGYGLHSKRGSSKIYPVVLDQLKFDPQLNGTVELRSVKPAYFEAVIKKNKNR